eukprot:NODE_7601_length_430_cov_296.656000.p3 GENE.NODE_7601_length_430_cov_296.656000~~NODE_7601_length_430_cov_296.656000.p3  ORF type:complete len:101 (+),score=30.45 NODE_7601_length_430_cov_296.656000:3-305(+)
MGLFLRPFPGSAEAVVSALVDHHTILSASTCLHGFGLMALFDGPRSGFFWWCLGLSDEEAEELYGSRVPSTWAHLLCRLRFPLYLALRGIVTVGWTSDAQ